MDIKLPNFAIFQCRTLKIEANTIKKEWDRIELTDITSSGLKMLLKEFLNTKTVLEKDIPRILNNLSQVEEILKDLKCKTSLEEFLKDMYKTISIMEIEKSVITTLEIIYAKIILNYKRKNIVDHLKSIGNYYLKFLEKTLIISKDTLLLKEFIESEKIVVDFFESKLKKNFFNNKGEYSGFDFELDYNIGEKTDLSIDIFKRFIELRSLETLKKDMDNISRKILLLKNKMILDGYYSKKEEEILFGTILEEIENWNIDDFPELWLTEMMDKLGEVNISGSDIILKNWTNFSNNQRSIFKIWITKGKLEEFFERRINEPERSVFWKKYLKYIKDIDFFQDLNQAIVLELTNHTVIEFGEVGNAAYVYSRENVTLKKLKYIANSSDSVRHKRNSLRDLKKPIPLNNMGSRLGWTHTTGWQANFSGKLWTLGYRT